MAENSIVSKVISIKNLKRWNIYFQQNISFFISLFVISLAVKIKQYLKKKNQEKKEILKILDLIKSIDEYQINV